MPDVIVVVGAGPTGLMLTAELALAGIETDVVDRRPIRELAGSRAGGLHSRTIEMLDQRGIADCFLAEGNVAQVAGFDTTLLDIMTSLHDTRTGLDCGRSTSSGERHTR